MSVPVFAKTNLRSTAMTGIALMVFGTFLFAVNDTLGKWLVATYSVGQVLLLRSIAALALLLPIMWNRGESLRPPRRLRMHGLRVVLSTMEVACFYWAVSYLPLADVMTFYLAGPIYVAVIAYFWLGERLDIPRMAVIGIGFMGVLVVLRPSGATLTLPAIIAIAGSLFYALLMIATRKLKEAPDTTLVLGQTMGALLMGAILSPFSWVPPDALDLAGLFLLGIVSMTAHACVNRSLKLAPASVVAPYQYTLIIWAIVLGYLAFGDIVQIQTLIGAAIICLAGFALMLLERRGTRRADIEAPILPEV
jgi:drug/metabolite transporter (DMT)-like permease